MICSILSPDGLVVNPMQTTAIRPERANPYPKKVIVFSPHPDDDVISMGGTLRRLCVQNHDVHVAYQTSGNIAVGDEEVIRYVSYLHNVCEKYAPKDNPVLKKGRRDKALPASREGEGEKEKPDVLFMKGTIRREEARTACRYTGVKDENVHFLDLPFYETGLVKKNDLGEADKDIVKALIEKIQPGSDVRGWRLSRSSRNTQGMSGCHSGCYR
jgi:glucosamine-6-phosphate deaminase